MTVHSHIACYAIQAMFLDLISSNWRAVRLNLLQIDQKNYGEDRESLMARLENNGIQTRPVWKLNHLQKPYRNFQSYKVERAGVLLAYSLCLPSSSNLTDDDINNVITQLAHK